MLSLAEIAQLVEHFTRNEGVVGSSPIFGFDRERIKKRFCEGRGVFFVALYKKVLDNFFWLDYTNFCKLIDYIKPERR